MRRVLLLHGVNSTGEWHARTRAECRGVFECESIRYRHFHGWWGPLKVYVWPTALFLCLAVLIGIGCRSWPISHRLLVVGGLVLVQTIAVTAAENEWAGAHAGMAVPILYGLAGLIGGAIAWAIAAEQAALSILIGVLAGLSIFLDLREYGGEKLSLGLAIFGSIVASLAGSWGATYLAAQPRTNLVWWTFGGLLLLAIAEPWFRRRQAFQFVKSRIEEAIERERFPHMVAHSLGTYLTGHMLNEDENLRLGRVFFTGCVLDRSFPWQDIVGPESRQGCWEVRNYVGRMDLVPIATGALRVSWVWLTYFARIGSLVPVTGFVGNWARWRPLGRAGQAGFREKTALVHSLKADTFCDFCEKDSIRTPVHNVRARFAGHSSLNQDPEYQSFHWLPCLWGDTPAKFDYWKEICRIGHKALTALEANKGKKLTPEERALYQTTLQQAERKLLAGPWYFPLTELDDRAFVCGRGLRAYVEEIVNALCLTPPVSADAILKRVPAFTFQYVATALNEKKKKKNGDKLAMARLEPCKALYAAVCTAVQEEQRAASLSGGTGRDTPAEL